MLSLWILGLIGALSLGIVAVIYMMIMFYYFAVSND
jgi:hypothetical protein